MIGRSNAKIKISVPISGVIENVWVTGASLPGSMLCLTSQLYNGKIYCPQSGGTAILVYDIASNSWVTGKAAPAAVNRNTSQLYNGKIYCPQSDGALMHIYDIATNLWILGVAAPTAVSRYTSQLYNGRIYCPQNNGIAMHIYDIATDTWPAGAPAPATKYRCTSQLYNGKIYCPSSEDTSIHIYDIATNSWTTGAPAPASVNRFTSQLYNGKIYCPQNGGTAMHIYNIRANSWTTGTPAPSSMNRIISHLYNGKIYCPSSEDTSMHIYDIATNSWTTGAIAPTAVSRYTSQLYNGKIYCPQSGGTAMHIYNALAFEDLALPDINILLTRTVTGTVEGYGWNSTPAFYRHGIYTGQAMINLMSTLSTATYEIDVAKKYYAVGITHYSWDGYAARFSLGTTAADAAYIKRLKVVIGCNRGGIGGGSSGDPNTPLYGGGGFSAPPKFLSVSDTRTPSEYIIRFNDSSEYNFVKILSSTSTDLYSLSGDVGPYGNFDDSSDVNVYGQHGPLKFPFTAADIVSNGSDSFCGSGGYGPGSGGGGALQQRADGDVPGPAGIVLIFELKNA